MFQLFTINARSQCGDSIDLSTWIKEGIAANGTWTVGGGGNSVTQSINGDPTFYVSPDSFINVRISGDIRVNTTADDDWIGFVFGYEEPDAGNSSNYDFYLFDWKQADQNFNGFFGPEGYSLSRMNGPITNLAQAFSSKAGPYATLIASQYGNGLGWNDLQTYSFTLTYTNTRVVINIDGDTIFDINGCFPPGRFGFYNYSLADVTYSDFSYEVAAAFKVLTPNVCLGDTAEFIALSDSCANAAGVPVNNTLVAWDWDFGDGGTSNDTNGRHLYNAAGTYTVRLVVTDYLNCTDTAYSTVEVHDTIIILDLDTTICPHDTVILDAGTFNTYLWNTGETTQAIQANAAGEYFLTVTNAYGCYKSDTVDIDHFSTPVLDLGADTLICNGDTVIFYASGPDTTVTYLWNTGSTIDSLVTSTPGTYICVVTDTNTCYSTDTVLVTNFAQPIVSPPNPVLCFGDTMAISASGANTYQWYPNYAISATTGTTIQTYTTVDTTYNVIGTDTNGCVDTSSFLVDVLDLPTVNFSGGDSICFGDSLPIIMTFTGTGPWTVTYATSGDTFTISGITTSVDSFIAMDSGSYVPISVSDANCTGFGGDSTTLYVQPLPVITLIAASDTICADDSISIVASGAAAYAWSPGTGLNDSTIASVLASPPITTTYTVVGTSAFGCLDSNTIDIEVKPLPVLVLNLTSDTICLEDTVQLTASGALSYLWVPQPMGSNMTGASINVSPTQFTTYEVFATAANGCVDSAEIDVTVDTLPAVYILPEDTAFCIYETAQLSVFGASTYVWSPSLTLSASTGSSVMAFPTDTTTYEVVGTDLNGCVGRDTILVTIYPLPNVVVAPQYTEVCYGLSDTFTVAGAQTYTWSPAYNLSATTGNSVVALVDVDTSYVVEGVDSNGCINTDTVIVNMLELPPLQLVADTDSVCLGITTQLEAIGATTYQWAPVAGLNAYNQASVIAQPTTTSTYEVYGMDVFGCVDSAETTIVVLPLPIIPITPVGGGICVGDSRQMVIANGYNYQWSPTSYLQLDGNNNDTVIATPPDTTTYTITATDGFECVSDTTYNLAVTPLPVLSVTIDNPTICLNGSTKLHVTGANTYVWGPAINLAGALTANPTVSPDSAVEYFVTATGPGGCQSIGSIEVEVFPVPNYSAGEDQEICIGDTTQLKAKGGVSYQ
ncbi:MAG: PKD domain-containing protein, partial [Flavobacteriales bacterium]